MGAFLPRPLGLRPVESESVTLTVDDAEYPGELTLPEDGGDVGAVLLPGANHGPYGDVFDRLAEKLAAEGITLLRFESWGEDESLPNLDERAVEDVGADFAAAAAFLVDRGYDRVGAVAKSFGGSVALRHCPDVVEELVLWAPADFLEGGETIENYDRPEGVPDDAALPTVAASALGDHDHPVTILQGDEDNFPVENARELAAHLPSATAEVIEGADHSFVGGDPETETVETTVELLAGDR